MKRILSTFSFLGFLVAVTPALAQEHPKEHPQGAEHPSSAMDAMMKAWQEFATPGAPHQAMMSMVGVWDTVAKNFMDPAHPSESKGTSTYTSLMDGRYLQEGTEGEAMGMPFKGIGIYGYDNMLKKHVMVWIDNFGTGIMFGTGTTSADGKTTTWTMKGSDPMTGKEQTYRSTMQQVTADQYVFEMFGPGPDGKEAKSMTITYNRRK